jgi:hypothetical protein
MIKWGSAGAVKPDPISSIFLPLHFAPNLSPNDFKRIIIADFQ